MLTALIGGLLGGFAMLVGALVAFRVKIEAPVLGSIMAFAAGTLECVSDVKKSTKPGDLYEVSIRTRSGFELKKTFPTKAGASKARDELLTRLLR